MRRRPPPSRHGQLTLPTAPTTGSPVPWLTSLHSSVERGPWGSSGYRGNCGGYLIKDLVEFFAADRVLDPMTGSGTCADVCADLGVACTSFDLKAGQDAGDPSSYLGLPPHDFAWLHPPYWQQVPYGDDPRCLSQAPTLEGFLDRMETVLAACRAAMAPGGHIAVLIGGYSHRGRYLPLPALLTARAASVGLWPACTEKLTPHGWKEHFQAGVEERMRAAAYGKGLTLSRWASSDAYAEFTRLHHRPLEDYVSHHYGWALSQAPIRKLGPLRLSVQGIGAPSPSRRAGPRREA